MIIKLLRNIVLDLFLLLNGGDNDMIAMLWGQEIIMGNKKYEDIPKLLKEQVKEYLINCGCEDLIK